MKNIISLLERDKRQHVRTIDAMITTYSILDFWGKWHFTTLNNTSNYTLHSKLFECTFCTLHYDSCYTLHPDINFIVNLDGKVWHHMKILNWPLPNALKTKNKLHFITLK